MTHLIIQYFLFTLGFKMRPGRSDHKRSAPNDHKDAFAKTQTRDRLSIAEYRFLMRPRRALYITGKVT